MICEQLTLHVGVPRTGTTTIQSFVDLNQSRLRELGILCVKPATLKSYSLQEGFEKEERLYAGLQELKQLLAAEGGNRILWSNETLSRYRLVANAKCLEMIKRELPAARYRVVMYLRRQDHCVRSSYLQWGIKCKYYPGPVLDFDDWLRCNLGDDFENLLEGNLDYAGLIQPWIDVFGRENVVIRVFERGQLLNGDLLQDFCDAAELPTADCSFKVPDQNVSFNMELHDMLGMYHSLLDNACHSVEMNRFVDALGQDEFLSRKFFSRFAIAPKCRIEILQRCEESNRKVAKEILGREDGVLFREPWPHPDDTYRPYGGLTKDRLVPILLHVLKEQDRRIHKLERVAKKLNVAGVAQSITKELKRRIANLVTLGKRRAEEEGDQSGKADSPVFADAKLGTVPTKEVKAK